MICKRLAWARSARSGGETLDPAPTRSRRTWRLSGCFKCFRPIAQAEYALVAIYLIAIKRDSLNPVYLGVDFQPIAQGVVQPRLPACAGFLECAHDVGVEANDDEYFWGVSAGLG